MNLRSRLSRLQSQAGAAAAPSASSLRERIAQLQARGRSLASAPVQCPSGAGRSMRQLAEALQGELLGDGLIRIRHSVPLRGRLGAFDLQMLRRRPRLPGDGSHPAPRRVYVDTETTGLSGGSGTLAFLAGAAVIGGEAIELTQFLLTRFAAEAALLEAFADLLRAGDELVSYNGKSYDLPLLVARFRMQSLAHPFGALAHRDLLHPVRRLFARRWNDCRLASVEQHLLGLRRVADLPGSEAPAAWFSWLRFGDVRALGRVVEHNRQDLVSLVAAHGALAQAVAQPAAFGVDLHGLARWLAEDCESAARELLQSHAEALCDDGRRLLARLLRRAGQWSQAVAIWEALAARGCTESLERLAKYHEHVSRDLAAARRCCDRLSGDPAHEQRRRRVQSKLESKGRRPP